MGMGCDRDVLRISYKDHVTNEEVCAKIQQAIGPHQVTVGGAEERKMEETGYEIICGAPMTLAIKGYMRER